MPPLRAFSLAPLLEAHFYFPLAALSCRVLPRRRGDYRCLCHCMTEMHEELTLAMNDEFFSKQANNVR